MKTLITIALLFLAACWTPPTKRLLTPEEEIVYYSVLACWPEEWEINEYCHLDEMEIVRAPSQQSFLQVCPEGSAGCLTWRWGALNDDGSYRLSRPIVVLSPESEYIDVRLAAHEMTHAFLACSTLDGELVVPDQFGYSHSKDDDVWKTVEPCAKDMAQGGETSD